MKKGAQMTEEHKAKLLASRRPRTAVERKYLESGDFRISSDEYNLILEKKNEGGSWVHHGYYGNIESLVHAIGKKIFMCNFPQFDVISQQLKDLDGKVKHIVAMFGSR